MNPAPVRSSQAWQRLVLVFAALVAFAVLPFLFLGTRLEQLVPNWLESTTAPLVIAALGITLLALDVLLPLPASLISVGLCWSLGPWSGALCVFIGNCAAFALGYALGAVMPRARLRVLVGAAAWDTVAQRLEYRAALWIGLSRPLPVLAELSAISAGLWRVPMSVAVPAALLSSAGVAAGYGVAVQIGQRQDGPGFALLASLALPFIYYLASSAWRARRSVSARPSANGDLA